MEPIANDHYGTGVVLPRFSQSIGWGTVQKVEYATIQARRRTNLAPVLLITNVILSGFVDDCFSIEGTFYADETMGAKDSPPHHGLRDEQENGLVRSRFV
jgi:hypothetical protein